MSPKFQAFILNLSDAHQTSGPDFEVKRWKREQRFDFLEGVDTFYLKFLIAETPGPDLDQM
jgi:hypothetical protein